MLDLNHPATNFIFQASYHLDQIKLMARKLDELIKEDMDEAFAVVLKETAVLRNIAKEEWFKKKSISIETHLATIENDFKNSIKTDVDFIQLEANIFKSITQLEYDFGTWAI